MPRIRPQPWTQSCVCTDMVAVAAIERDAELMLRVRDGDAASFTLLLERHRLPVIHFLYRMTLNQAVAEELAQDVFLRVFRSRASYEPTAKFTTWLFRIATHLALNHIRDGRYARASESLEDRELRDQTPTVEQRLLRDATLREIRLAVEALPPKQRAAVLMHKYEEMEYTQIAGALGCSESALKSLLFRAYATLRSRLSHMV